MDYDSGMPGYYNEKLAGDRLRACYDLAPLRVRRYLEAEIEYVLQEIAPGSAILELGCGYGRILIRLLPVAGVVAGIDTSRTSLRMAGEQVGHPRTLHLLCMDAASMGFAGGSFDCTLCLQNGISAFGVDPLILLREAVRVTRPGGRVLFSSYAERFWPHRLEWFEAQAAHGLIGEIDQRVTGNGVIVCRDGFRATTVAPGYFREMAAKVGIRAEISEVDGSSVFCELVVPGREQGGPGSTGLGPDSPSSAR